MFELRPDIFPEGYLTQTEIQLWDWFYAEIKKDNK